MTRVLRTTGWTLILAGAVVLLYVVYSLFFTNTATRAAQADMLDRWQDEVGALSTEAPQPPAPNGDTVEELPGAEDPEATSTGLEAVEPGEAVAVLQFHRPGEEPPVSDEPLFVVQGVTQNDLTRGPGHYPESSAPGGEGNFAVAGHRTTYGAPFFHLDQLIAGDEVHVTDRDGQQHVYRVTEQRVVTPSDVWVVNADPLENGARMLTLTTCHPRFSARERLVVFAELVA